MIASIPTEGRRTPRCRRARVLPMPAIPLPILAAVVLIAIAALLPG